MLVIQILISFLLGILVLIGTAITIGYLLSCKNYEGPKTAHFNGRRFQNPSRVNAKGFKEVGEYARKRKQDKWPSDLDQGVRKEPLDKINANEIQYTFINHSSFLIQLGNFNILTDPIWSNRCSPFQFMGPARQRPPGLPFDLLPSIDLVLLSHNHYDHMDKNTIKKLNKKYSPTFIVPLGLKHTLKKWGCEKILELDWWQEIEIQNIQLKAMPANHFSSRGTFDRNTTLWCGYTIQTKNAKLYFAGDTGYSNIFKEIGLKEGPFDLSMIPIGAYLPEWFMSPIHISPQQAVQVHLDVNSKQSVAMHFGTFKLADDSPVRAKAELIEALVKADIEQTDFIIPIEGQSHKLKSY